MSLLAAYGGCRLKRNVSVFVLNDVVILQERSLEEYKRLLEGAETKEKDLLSIIRRLEDQVSGQPPMNHSKYPWSI